MLEEILTHISYLSGDELKKVKQRVDELIALKAERARLIKLLWPNGKK